MNEVRVFAPGSLFVIGEYAVLHGERALVAAVDSGIECRAAEAAGWWLSAPDLGVDMPLEDVPRDSGAGLLAEAVQAGDAVFTGPGPLRVTVRGHGWGAGEKIGLGGSAASVVAVLGALAAASGHDVTSPALRRALLPAAVDVHRAHQGGRGSGGDVAAAVLGGWVGYRTADGTPHAEPAPVPPRPHLAVAWSGLSASTPAGIDRFHRMGKAGVDRFLAALHDELDRFWAASRAGDWAGFRHALSAYGTLLDDLARRLAPGEAARMALLTRAAADRGVAAKSSGTVGGDCVIAVGPDGAPLAEVRRAWRRLDALPLDVAPDTGGLRPLGTYGSGDRPTDPYDSGAGVRDRPPDVGEEGR
ncbi:mevalonate kinase [Streptomyces sp. NPDC048718]|uniref:mevalonate kinase family protein n=1 Tax=Streptomyces sp. NPDC048718 TaxID=3365587 RepID=UPI003716F7DC